MPEPLTAYIEALSATTIDDRGGQAFLNSPFRLLRGAHYDNERVAVSISGAPAVDFNSSISQIQLTDESDNGAGEIHTTTIVDINRDHLV